MTSGSLSCSGLSRPSYPFAATTSLFLRLLRTLYIIRSRKGSSLFFLELPLLQKRKEGRHHVGNESVHSLFGILDLLVRTNRRLSA